MKFVFYCAFSVVSTYFMRFCHKHKPQRWNWSAISSVSTISMVRQRNFFFTVSSTASNWSLQLMMFCSSHRRYLFFKWDTFYWQRIVGDVSHYPNWKNSLMRWIGEPVFIQILTWLLFIMIFSLSLSRCVLTNLGYVFLAHKFESRHFWL